MNKLEYIILENLLESTYSIKFSNKLVKQEWDRLYKIAMDNKLKVETTGGQTIDSDFYDPTKKMIKIKQSKNNFIGQEEVATLAHELGHYFTDDKFKKFLSKARLVDGEFIGLKGLSETLAWRWAFDNCPNRFKKIYQKRAYECLDTYNLNPTYKTDG